MNKAASILLSLSLTLALSATTALAQSESPVLRVVTPSENQTIYGPRIPILVSVDNFEVIDYQQNPTLRAGQGHVHLWLDDPNPTAESAVKLTDDSFTYTDVNFGEHTVRAELVNNNHTSLRPPVVTTIKFKSAPAASPAPAQAASFDKNTALVILVVVSIIIVAAWWYTKDEAESLEETRRNEKPKKTPAKRKTAKRRSKKA